MSTVILDASSLSEKEKVNQWIFHACSANGMPELYNDITWTFDNRLTNCMGKAWASAGIIKLSNKLWPRASEQERKNVAIHESVHIVARRKYGLAIKSHGKEWQHCMRIAGETPNRCHEVDNSGLRRQIKRYVFICPNCNKVFNLTTAKYNRYLRYATCWRCPMDHHELKFTGTVFVRS